LCASFPCGSGPKRPNASRAGSESGKSRSTEIAAMTIIQKTTIRVSNDIGGSAERWSSQARSGSLKVPSGSIRSVLAVVHATIADHDCRQREGDDQRRDEQGGEPVPGAL